MAKLLIDNFKNEIDISLPDDEDKSYLYCAVRKGNIDMIKLLIDNFKTK